MPDYLEPGTNPNILPQPKNEDNIGWIGYRNSAEGYLKLLLRLEDAAQDPNSRIFTIDNRTPGGNPIGYKPGWGEVVDVSDVETFSRRYAEVKADHINDMLTGLAADPLAIEEREIMRRIGRVYPPVFLLGPRRSVRMRDRVKAATSSDTREENQGIVLFRDAVRQLQAMQASINLTMGFAYQGFLHLMAGIADATIEDNPSDSLRLQHLKRFARGIDQELAHAILLEAYTVLTPREQVYNMPDDYQA